LKPTAWRLNLDSSVRPGRGDLRVFWKRSRHRPRRRRPYHPTADSPRAAGSAGSSTSRVPACWSGAIRLPVPVEHHDLAKITQHHILTLQVAVDIRVKWVVRPRMANSDQTAVKKLDHYSPKSGSPQPLFVIRAWPSDRGACPVRNALCSKANLLADLVEPARSGCSSCAVIWPRTETATDDQLSA